MGRISKGYSLYRRKGSPNYWARATVKGKQRRVSTGTENQREAAGVAQNWYAELISGKEVSVSNSAVLVDVLPTWIAHVEPLRSKETVDTLIYYCSLFCREWNTIDEIDSAAVEDYTSRRIGKVSIPTVRKELSALRQFMGWAHKRNLVGEVPKIESPKGKTDFEPVWLTQDEVEKVLAVLPVKYRDTYPRAYYTVMWSTGQRKGTLSRLRWEDLDLDAARLSVRASAEKRQYARVLPLEPRAVEALKGLAEVVAPSPTALVFGVCDLRGTLRAAARAAGVDEKRASKLRNHSIRHSRGTFLLEKTANLAGVQFLLGHKNLSTTQRYLHGSERAAKDVLESVAADSSTIEAQ